MSRGRHRRPGMVSKTVATGTTVASGAAISGVAVMSSHGTALASDIPQVPQQVQEYKAEAVQAVRAVPRTYTVRSGDYLSRIAKAHCATASDWTGIYEHNKNVIGPNPDLIEVGQRLVLDCHVVQVSRDHRSQDLPETGRAARVVGEPVPPGLALGDEVCLVLSPRGTAGVHPQRLDLRRREHRIGGVVVAGGDCGDRSP